MRRKQVPRPPSRSADGLSGGGRRVAPSSQTTRMAAYFLTAAAMSLPALGMLRCCCRRRVSAMASASASLLARPSGALIIDTDRALDDLATLALAAACGASKHACLHLRRRRGVHHRACGPNCSREAICGVKTKQKQRCPVPLFVSSSILQDEERP